ncbi:MAG: hypothetical protein AABZ23_06425 [Deltaproteobacteria bacterium]
MAEFLIKAVDSTNPNPSKDVMCYKRGDIVVVMPDGHAWGGEERLPAFLKVFVHGLPVDAGYQTTHEGTATQIIQRDYYAQDWQDLCVRWAAGERENIDWLYLPVAIGTRSEVLAMDIDIERWSEMVSAGAYPPYDGIPAMMPTTTGQIQLSGSVSIVTVEGLACVETIRRRYSLNVDAIMFVDGQATLTELEFMNLLALKG